MGTCSFRVDIVGELFCERTTEIVVAAGSDANVHALNRRATTGLPSKAAGSGAQLSSSREDDARAHHGVRPFF